MYDADIIPRVALYLQVDGRFDDTSVWALGQRRLVTLMGCVHSKEQSAEMERAVLLVDDVMGVINLLSVGAGPMPASPCMAHRAGPQ
ncbi:MAG: BON domain-containing protein [Giesbergeria sp.]